MTIILSAVWDERREIVLLCIVLFYVYCLSPNGIEFYTFVRLDFFTLCDATVLCNLTLNYYLLIQEAERYSLFSPVTHLQLCLLAHAKSDIITTGAQSDDCPLPILRHTIALSERPKGRNSFTLLTWTSTHRVPLTSWCSFDKVSFLAEQPSL